MAQRTDTTLGQFPMKDKIIIEFLVEVDSDYWYKSLPKGIKAMSREMQMLDSKIHGKVVSYITFHIFASPNKRDKGTGFDLLMTEIDALIDEGKIRIRRNMAV